MVRLIDDHRDAYGVEPICTVLPIAPSTYHRHRAGQLDPRRRSARAHRDDALRPEIQRVYNAHYQVYGPRKVWKQLRREGFARKRPVSIREESAPSGRIISVNHTRKDHIGEDVGLRRA